MLRSKIWAIVSLLVVFAMALAACTSQATPPAPQEVTRVVVVEGTPQIIIATAVPTDPEPVVEEPVVLRLSYGPSDIPTIDTALATDVISIQIIGETLVGLVRQNETTAELEPGMAKSWDISADGLTYTFHLQENIPWVRYNGETVEQVLDCDGNPRTVTADDYVYGILRTLNPATASDYAYVLNSVVEGAAAYNDGTATEPATVGVKAIDPLTLEVKFMAPAVYNLNIIGLWVANAQPKWIIDGDDCTEGRGARWTETGFYQGYGPFTLKEWVHDASLTIVKNPFWPGTDNIPVSKIDEVNWRIIDTAGSLTEFEAGNMDVAGIPSGDMDRVTSDPAFKDMIFPSYTIGTEFYSFNTKLAPTDDVRVRQALSYAIDRTSIVTNITKSNDVAQWFTHPGAAGAPKMDKYSDLGIKYDPIKAKELLDSYLKEKGITADKLEITLMFNTSDANKKLAEAIQQMWKDTLGINVTLTNQERKVFIAARKEGLEQIYRSSWVQDYPDTNNFLYEVFGYAEGVFTGAYANVVDWQEGEAQAKFMELTQAAAVEKDPAKRMELYAQAEKILVVDEAIIAPLYWYSGKTLVRPEIKHNVSITGYDFYEKWEINR